MNRARNHETLAESLGDYDLTLREFQASGGIPIDKQIVLLNNPGIFKGFTPYQYPYRNKRVARRINVAVESLKSVVARNGRGKIRSNRIFVGYYDRSFDHLDILDEVFRKIESQPQERFQLLIGKGDYSIEPSLEVKIPGNVELIFVNNLNSRDTRFRYLPMGRDFRSVEIFKDRQPVADKQFLCYCNFSVDTHPVRRQLQEMVEDKPFVTKQHLGEFLNYSITREEFFDALESSKFCICPRGNAYDTFRMWDALYSGTVPIVVREAVFHELLEDLPILFFDSYEEFKDLDEKSLESCYERMLDTKFDFSKLTAEYWLRTRIK